MEQISRILLMLTSFASIVSTQSLVSQTEVRIPDDPGFYVQIAACCHLPIPINLYLPASENSQCGYDLVQCIANQVLTKLKPKFLSLEEKNKNLELAVNLLKQQMQIQQNRKDLRCESGNVGQHKFPAPAWPYTANVTFQSPFDQPPTVTFGLYLLDNGWDKNLRLRTDVSGITGTGFQISVNTWSDTVLYGARIRWMACGK